MGEPETDTTIGTGGWALVVAAGLVSFAVLWSLLNYHLFPAAVFALAIALVVLLILHRLALAVTRYEDGEAQRQVRRIVPASAAIEGGARVSGIEGAQASPVVAVPVRPALRSDPAKPVPLRPSDVVTPLSRLEPAPILPPQPVAVAPAAHLAAETVPAEAPVKTPVASAVPEGAKAPKAAAMPKAAAKPKGEPKPKAEFKVKTDLVAKAAAAPMVGPAVGPADRPKGGSKAKAGEKPKAAAQPKAAKVASVGLVRLTAPRGGKADDLKLIDGVGPALEKLVNSLGFYHFDQIAAWTDADIALVDAELKSFKGRAARDRWVIQAKILANGGTVEEAATAAKA